MTTFTVAYDPGYEAWIVLSTETKARSFAMIPDGVVWRFEAKSAALEQAAAISGQNIPLRMIETPERFEAVADSIYGAAW